MSTKKTSQLQTLSWRPKPSDDWYKFNLKWVAKSNICDKEVLVTLGEIHKFSDFLGLPCLQFLTKFFHICWPMTCNCSNFAGQEKRLFILLKFVRCLIRTVKSTSRIRKWNRIVLIVSKSNSLLFYFYYFIFLTFQPSRVQCSYSRKPKYLEKTCVT